MRLRKAGKIAAFTVGGMLALVLLLMLIGKLALDRAPAYQVQIKDWIHRQSGYYVDFSHVSPGFRWYGPELYFDHVQLRSKDDRRVLAHADGARVALDLRRFFSTGKLLAGRVELDSPAMAIVRTGPNTFALAAEIELGGGGQSMPNLTLDDFPAGELAIRRGRLTLQNWNDALPQLPLRDLSLDLTRRESVVTLKASASLPEVLGGNLNVRGSADGLGDLNTLAWNVSARARGIAFRGWRELLPDYLSRLDTGQGDFELTARGAGAVVKHADLNFAARGITTQLQDGPTTKFDSVSGTLTLEHKATQWSLTGRRVRASHAGSQDPDSDFDIAWNAGDTGLLGVTAHASYLHLDTLLPLTGLLPQAQLRERLHDLALTGECSNTDVSMSRKLADDPWALRVRAKFRDIGFAPVGRAPGVRGLSGSIEGTDSGGHLIIDSRFALYTWPTQIPAPIQIQNLKSTLYWRRTATSLLVATPQFALNTPDVGVHGKLAWEVPADGSSPLVTLAAIVENGNVVATSNYLPVQFIAPPAYAWLNRAFSAGRLSRADVVLQGPITHYPFRDNSGLFLARCNMDGMTLDYHEGWMPVSNLALQVEFRNQGMRVHALAGRLGDLKITGAEARFPDFKNGELQVDVALSGDAADALGFLRATPIDALVDRSFSVVDANGAMQAKVSLFLPFKQFDQRLTQTHLQFDGITASRRGSPLAASGITGEVDVENAQVTRADVHGRVLNGPFQMTARAPRTRLAARTQLDFRGTLSGEALHDAVSLPASIPLSGSTDWHAVFKVAAEPARERSLRVSSDLTGLELKLPSPLAKPAAAQLPTMVEILYAANTAPQARFNLGTVLSGTFSIEFDGSSSHLGHVALDFGATGEPGLNDGQAFSVNGSVQRVDLAGWLKLIPPPDKNTKPLWTYFRGAKINVAQLDYIGLSFFDLGIDLAVSDSGLRIGLSGPNVVGNIAVPSAQDAGVPWIMQFQRLRFVEQAPDRPAPDGVTASGAPPGGSLPAGDPRSIPPISFHAAELLWGDRQFGEVQASIGKLDDGIVLKALSVTSPVFTAQAHGEWRGKDAGTAHLSGSIDTTDLGAALTQLGYKKIIEAKTGHAEFDVQWIGAPTATALAQANGRVQIALDKGQIVGLSPGAGRVLGLTSLAALPRRLALDFSDLTDKGFAFDTAKGDFELGDGNATTEDAVVKGPAAEIGLIGRVGLKNRDYDQTVVVTNALNKTPLPLAGFVAGPAVGVTFLLFSQVFKGPLKGLARAYYRITGSWDNPTVERIKNAEAAATTAEAPK